MSEQYPAPRDPQLRRTPPHHAKGNKADLVDVILRPYGETFTYYVGWEVKPKNPKHGILRVEVFIQPEGLDMINFRVIAQDVATSGDIPKVPAGVMLRGESGHRNIPPGTKLQIDIWGDIQVSDDAIEEYSYCATVVSGDDRLHPCP